MNKTGKTIAKNASVLMASQLITWGLSLLLMLSLPRLLGATAVGQFHLANSIWAIVSVFAIFGTNVFLTKEISRSPAKMSDVFGTILLFRAFAFVLGAIFIAVYVQFTDYETETIYVIFIIGFSSLFMLFAGAHRATLQGLERMEFISIADIASKAFMTGVSLIFLYLGKGIIVISFVAIGTSIINLLIQAFYLNRLHPIHFRTSWQIAKQIIKASFPYFLVSVFAIIYIQLDIVIISLLVDEEVVGWYAAADSLFATFLFIPTIFMAAVFPALTRLHTSEDEKGVQGKLMSKSFDLLAVLSIPIGLGVMAIADSIVVLLFGEGFINSGPVLSIMGIVLILTYQNMLLGRFIISVDRQNSWTIVMATATVATIALDLFLIPWTQRVYGNGAIGGALAFVITEAGIMIVGLYLLPRGMLGRKNAWTAARALIAGLGMVAAVWFLRDFFIAIPIIVGAVVYLLLIILMRVIPKEDWALLGGMAQQILARLPGRKSNLAE